MAQPFSNTDFINYPLFVRGKVRDVYDLGEELLMVATDRISAFDVVFDEPIPDKGKVLNGISAFWFGLTTDIVPNHVITTDVLKYPGVLPNYADRLSGRSMLVRKMEMVKVECIVRGYLEGSGLKEYMAAGMVSGIRLPEGLKQCDRLPEPVFTPSTKAEEGHDMNVTFNDVANVTGSEMAGRLKDASIRLYMKAAAHAESKGIILADTKFEFGICDGKLTIGDEMCTPDSSRFWEMSEYEPGRPQRSFDKQYLREYLESTGWDKRPPAPHLPSEIIAMTRGKYIEAFERITGRKFI